MDTYFNEYNQSCSAETVLSNQAWSLFFIKQARYHAEDMTETIVLNQYALNSFLRVTSPEFYAYLATACVSSFLQTQSPLCMLQDNFSRVDSVFELLHQYLVKQLTDEAVQSLIVFTMSFFKQLLFKKPEMLYQEDALFTLPSFFVEFLYLLISRQKSEERSCLVMLLSLYLQLPHDAIAGDYSYLPAMGAEEAHTVMARWEQKDLSAFGLTLESIHSFYQDLPSLLADEMVFSQFCLSLPLLVNTVSYAELFTTLWKVQLSTLFHIVFDCQCQLHQHFDSLPFLCTFPGQAARAFHGPVTIRYSRCIHDLCD